MDQPTLISMLYLIAAILILLSIPAWLPPFIIRLRMKIFVYINGADAIELPNESLQDEEFRRIYTHPNVDIRSRGAALSDLFWYWLSPGPEMHQEHLENGARYQKIAGFTRQILAQPRDAIESLVDRNKPNYTQLFINSAWTLQRIRDLMMPFWAGFYYELVFAESCDHTARKLIVDNASDVVNSLKCCSLRHMDRREALTRFLVNRIENKKLPYPFPAGFSTIEQAFYLQGTFFNTAIVQMSEAMAHTIVALALHPDIQQQLHRAPDDRALYDRIINETLRLYPLFGIAHRITSADITVGKRAVKKGSVICFNYPAYHQLNFDQADQFLPERWQQCPVKSSNFIPFGVTANRPCPAQGIALISMRRLTQHLIKDIRFATSIQHSRSLPNRGPCLLISRRHKPPAAVVEKLILWWIKLSDQWENVYRSLKQLILGTIMVIDARRLRLCEHYFNSLETEPDNRNESCKQNNC